MLDELFPIVVVILATAVVTAAILQRNFRSERGYVLLSYTAHIVAAFGQVWVTRIAYGYGDMITYHGQGRVVARLLRLDFLRFAPEVVLEVFHQESSLPYRLFGSGNSTGTLSALSGLLCYALDDSLYASCLLVSFWAFLGSLALYSAFREQVPAHQWRYALVSTLLIPSVVFWTSGVIKESFALGGLGFAVLGIWRLRRNSVFYPALLITGGALVVALVKVYVLFPLALAWGVWLYWRRATRNNPGVPIPIRPLRLLVAGAFSVALLVALGELFPLYSIESLSERTAKLQDLGAMAEGGSNYALAEDAAPTAAGQLIYAPIALITALFRPSIVEARNALMVVNALETTAFAAVLAWGLFRGKPARLWASVRSSPVLMFSLSFTLVMAVAVGLATTNLGTLSRYRVPFVPFFAFLVLLSTARTVQRTAVKRTAPAPVALRRS